MNSCKQCLVAEMFLSDVGIVLTLWDDGMRERCLIEIIFSDGFWFSGSLVWEGAGIIGRRPGVVAGAYVSE